MVNSITSYSLSAKHTNFEHRLLFGRHIAQMHSRRLFFALHNQPLRAYIECKR